MIIYSYMCIYIHIYIHTYIHGYIQRKKEMLTSGKSAMDIWEFFALYLHLPIGLSYFKAKN